MRGVLAYVLGVASVAALIPWPEYWPLAFVNIALAIGVAYSDPRPHGGNLTKGAED